MSDDAKPYFSIDGHILGDGTVVYTEKRDPKVLLQMGIDPDNHGQLVYEFVNSDGTPL
jgi:hypothetical protein